jgi:hypothetical protein
VFKKIYIRVMKGKGRNKQFMWCLAFISAWWHDRARWRDRTDEKKGLTKCHLWLQSSFHQTHKRTRNHHWWEGPLLGLIVAYWPLDYAVWCHAMSNS